MAVSHKGGTEVATLLIEQGADINAWNVFRETDLILLEFHNKNEDIENEIIQLLLEAGVE